MSVLELLNKQQWMLEVSIISKTEYCYDFPLFLFQIYLEINNGCHQAIPSSIVKTNVLLVYSLKDCNDPSLQYIFFKNLGATSKIWYMNQVPFLGPKNIIHHRKIKSPLRPYAQDFCTPDVTNYTPNLVQNAISY